MKKNIIIFSLLVLAFFLTSCANSKVLEINGKVKTVEPYGWADVHEMKDPNVNYQLNVGNVVWSVILSESIIVPIWLTGFQIYEPVSVKVEAIAASDSTLTINK